MRVGSGTLLGRYVQRPTENRRRLIDYSHFLDEGEKVTAIEVSVTPSGFTVGTLVIGPDGDKVAYYASGGVDGEEYVATFTVTTTVQQIVNHDIRFAVRESSLRR